MTVFKDQPTNSHPSVYRGVGCILSEMCSGKALFPGSTVDEELYLIFKVSEVYLVNTDRDDILITRALI